jgi:tripartite-type tricarboxylate transporter receptor subunit TctC
MTFARFAASAIVGLLVAAQNVSHARAQDYPTRPVTLIAPWRAGGAFDTLCRILGPKLSDRLGKPVIIENRAGAASVIGTASVAKAAPDGYTLLMGGGTALAVAVTVYKRLGYDPTKDFAVNTPSRCGGSISDRIHSSIGSRGGSKRGNGKRLNSP